MSTTAPTSGVMLGVYEKALPPVRDWDDHFDAVSRTGFSFVDLSIDETAQRMSRLSWTAAERADVRAAAARQGVAIGGLCLSAHRAIAPGSTDRATRRRALEMLVSAIDLTADLGAPLLQLAGYYAFYEDGGPGARDRYLEVLGAGADYAARSGVMLGLENVDGTDVTSVTRALEVCDDIDSAYLQLYPDIGNLAEQQLDIVAELAAGHGRMLALHVKETRPGEPRRVPMGEGVVPWAEAFAELARQAWTGRVMIEMWNDDRDDAELVSENARLFVEQRLSEAGIPVVSPDRVRLDAPGWSDAVLAGSGA